MNNKVIKVISLVLILVVCFSVTALALDPSTFMSSVGPNNVSALNTLGGTIINVMQVVATVVAIAVLLFVGIKFLLASPAQKANIKDMLIPYVIGAVLIFATVPILGIIKSIAGGLSGTPTTE